MIIIERKEFNYNPQLKYDNNIFYHGQTIKGSLFGITLDKFNFANIQYNLNSTTYESLNKTLYQF
jgi:hypothetical protein